MELAELLAIQPQDYLQNGFFDADGEMHEGINGYYSLAMAYRCRDEKITADSLKAVVDQLEGLVSSLPSSVDDDPEQAIDRESLAAIDKIFKRKEALGSATVTAIYAAAKPHVETWRDFAGLVMHLDRVLSQLALMLNLPRDEPAE